MSNDFSTIKLNQSSEKFYLIRIVPKRYLNDSLTSIGGCKYSCVISYYPQKLMASDTVLTQVETVSNPGEYSFDESTFTLTVYSTPSSSNILVYYYYLFYTSGRHRVVSEDPEDSNTTLRDWLPRIKSNPSITSSIENIIEGQFTLNISTLTVINYENELQNTLTNNDSYYHSEIKVWLCLDSVENIQKIYDGRITGIKISDDQAIFDFEDPFSRLQESALMVDTADEA